MTGYRMLRNKSIAGRGIARLVSWLSTADHCLTVILDYIDVFDRVQLLVGPTLAPKTKHSTNLQDFKSLLTCSHSSIGIQ